MAQPAGAPSCSPPFPRSGEPKVESAQWWDASAAAWRDAFTFSGWKDREITSILPITHGQCNTADVLAVFSSSLRPWAEDYDRATPAKRRPGMSCRAIAQVWHVLQSARADGQSGWKSGMSQTCQTSNLIAHLRENSATCNFHKASMK
jgi:hypothetical protein